MTRSKQKRVAELEAVRDQLFRLATEHEVEEHSAHVVESLWAAALAARAAVSAIDMEGR